MVDDRPQRDLVVGAQLEVEAHQAVARAVEAEDRETAAEDVVAEVVELFLGRVGAGDQDDQWGCCCGGPGQPEVPAQLGALERQVDDLHRVLGKRPGHREGFLGPLQGGPELPAVVREQEAGPVVVEAGGDVGGGRRLLVAGRNRLDGTVEVAPGPGAPDAAPLVPYLYLRLDLAQLPGRDVVGEDPPAEELPGVVDEGRSVDRPCAGHPRNLLLFPG